MKFGRAVDRKSHRAGRGHGIGSFVRTRSSCQPLHFSHPFLQHALRRIAMHLGYWLFGMQGVAGHSDMSQHRQQAGKMPATLRLVLHKPPTRAVGRDTTRPTCATTARGLAYQTSLPGIWESAGRRVAAAAEAAASRACCWSSAGSGDEALDGRGSGEALSSSRPDDPHGTTRP